MQAIEWQDFEKVELRIGTIRSAQITAHYNCDQRVGRQVLCICSFAPKQKVGVRLEILVTGVHDDKSRLVLAGFDKPLSNAARLA